jgi:hypothetical protein
MTDVPQIIVPGIAEAREQRPAPPSGKTAVSIHEGLVVLHFERATEYAVYDPVGAVSDGARMLAFAVLADRAMAPLVINAAMFLIDHVYETCGDLKPAGGAAKHELIERHRRTLTRRLEVVMNSQREKKKVSNAKLAQEAVEIMLREVFQ